MPSGPNTLSPARRFLTSRFNSIALPIVVALVAAAALAAGAGALPSPAGEAKEMHHAAVTATGRAPHAASAESKTDERIEAERITLQRTGFEPSEITRRHGRFLIAFDDRSGLEDVTLSLVRQTGVRVHDVGFDRNKKRWREIINLPPGYYRLTVANHPEWVCNLTITAG